MIRLHRYSLVEEIERGEFWSIHRALQGEQGPRVLVRVLEREHPSPSEVAQLRHEYELERELGPELEGLVDALELVSQGHGLALVWAEPSGAIPLARLLGQGPVALDLGLRIAASLARTLAGVHACGIIHKNINPASVLVDPETGATHLLGFGLASRLSQEQPGLTDLSTLEATLAYISPELSGRMNRRVDRRSDLYSLGVVTYELVTGTLPFAGADAMELVHAHLVRQPQPLAERAPGRGIPAIVSELVVRLLAKNAEDRYQHAASLAADLDTILAALERGAQVEPFPLAVGDDEASDPFAIPQRLYGREAEREALLAAWDQACAGSAQLLVVRGYSGIGKSVLVREVHKALTGARAHFVAGKFDQLGRVEPYAPLRAALAELVHLLLTQSSEALEHLASELHAALGREAGVLTAMVPELERILGTPAPAPRLEGSAARRRLEGVLGHLLRVTTSSGQPLVVFLDDLQWADLASLELLEALLARLADCPILWIGAYRSNEVDADHPLSASLGAIEQTGRLRSIELGPLGRGDVQRLLADALAMTIEDVASLARQVYAKTEGNPFFVIQLLRAVHEDGCLRWDQGQRRYTWDEQALAETAASDNVVEFMAARLERLPGPTRRLLELGACIGHRFSLSTLAAIAECSLASLGADLWPALERGIVVALDPSHLLPREGEAPADLRFRFVHDRVQQAAYAGLDEAGRPGLHLRIGRLLEAGGASSDGFELVTHLNIGRGLVEDPSEQVALAQLNLDVGRRAQAAAAYDSAAQLFAVGVELLGEGGFADHPRLAHELHVGVAEVGILGGAHDEAAAAIDRLIDAGRDELEQAVGFDLRVVLEVGRGHSAAAVKAGLAGLGLLGFELPETDEARQRAYETLLAELTQALAGATLEALADRPELDDPHHRLALRLARHTALSAFGTATSLGYWLTALAAWLSLEHGHSEQSSSAYALLAAVLASSTTRFAEAHTLASLALAVHERRGDGVHEACMLGFYFVTVSHYSRPWRELLPELERSRLAGLEAGDHLFHSYVCSHQSVARLMLGDALDEVRPEVERALARMRDHQLASAAATQTLVRQMIACLEGRSAGPTSLSDEGFDEHAFVEQMRAAEMSFALHIHRAFAGALRVLAGDHEGALALLEPTLEVIPIAFTPESRWFLALALLGLDSEARRAHPKHAALVERCRRDYATWAAASPANYRHRQLVIEAEVAAGEAGGLDRAMALYDQASAAAEAHAWPRDRAIILELAAKFYLARGRLRIARAYMTDASYGYAAWGARGRVAALAEEFPELVPIEASLEVERVRARDGAIDALDMLAFARSLQTIAREVELDSVVEQTMRLVLHSAGAERAVLVLERETGLEVYATIEAEPARLELSPGTTLDDHPELPAQVLRYVARLTEPLVLEDAVHDPRFASDPYIAGARPRSIACLRMTHNHHGRGLLYLENNTTSRAFTARRLELLGLLSSQAMISIDNAELYARVQSVKDEIATTNAKLESEVADQTTKLREVNARLQAELVERERIQRERLAELSTPVIPLSPEILIMPLIGSLDDARVLDMREHALSSAHQRRAKFVIFDLTGVRGGDRAVAEALLATARALRLIGAEIIVSGVSPKLALVLLEAGTEVQDLRTVASLEDAVQAAHRATC